MGQVINKRPAVIFDLDGTLADITHRLPFIKKEKPDWQSFTRASEFDKPHNDIIELAQLYYNVGYIIIICSGRTDDVMDSTVKWLEDHNVPFDELHMRRVGDYRKDSTIKSEMLFDLKIRYEIKLSVDDRSSMVEFWREQGIRCLQVAKGDF